MTTNLRIRRQAGIFLILATALALLAGYALERTMFRDRPVTAPVTLGGKWIRPPGDLDYQGSFRKTIFLNSYPKHAWLMISAQDGFEVIVNGKSVDHLFLWRPTRQFQSGLSEAGQRAIKTLPLLALNFPREYQWGSHRSYEQPIYMDLTPYLQAGENSICVSVETRKLPARFNLSGEIATYAGETLPIASDNSWKASPTASYGGAVAWTEPHFDDQEWAQAVECDAPPGDFIRLLEPAIYQKPFEAARLSAPVTASEDISLEKDWTLDGKAKDGWLRVLSNRPYDLFINGSRVNTEHRGTVALDAGDWIIGTQKPTDAHNPAELLDPDEAGALDEDNRFLAPPHTDPTADDLHHYQDQFSQEQYSSDHPDETKDRSYANEAGGLTQKDDDNALQKPRALSFYAPETRTPAPLKVDRRLEQFDAYSIAGLLKPGVNHIRIRLLPAAEAAPLAWAPEAALDAGATLADGSTMSLESGPGWQALVQNAKGETTSTLEAVPGGAARTIGISLPALNYHGFVYDQGAKMACLLKSIALMLLLIVGGGFWALRKHPATRRALTADEPVTDEDAGLAEAFIARGTEAVLLPAALLTAACALQAAWGERQEVMFFWSGGTWALLLLAALALMGVSVFRKNTPDKEGRSFIERFPDSLGWKAMVLGLLMLCFYLPSHGLDFHPVDDDEYASIEASVAIAHQGVPKYSDDVWYTRSPLYHYVDGAAIWLFGENLWAMRLPSVLLGVATALLTYHCGRRLLRSPWVGLGALCLYTLHPFMIFSAHIARFYQMQQFFALLTVYCFCRGFVVTQSMRFRYATVGAFLCAVLSQELSVVIGLQLAVGYFLFAEKKPWRDEARFMVVSGCAILLIAVDLVAFQTRCLTHTEGVSPIVEATIHPQFANPLNFLSIFVAYSRLHLLVTALFLVGLPFALKKRNRHVAALYFFVFSGVIFTNLIVTGDGLRYQYWLMPLWLLLGVYGPKAVLDHLDGMLSACQENRSPARLALGATCFLAALLSFSPWRILDSYDAKLLGDSTGAFQYVRANLRPGDKVAATEPHPAAALMETGRADYDLAFPRLYDFVYMKDGRLVDRNAGATSVSSLDAVQSMLAHNDRVWIVVNREKMRSTGEDIRWAYPGATAEQFLRQNCQIAYQSYLWTVFLWDVKRGDFTTYRTSLTD